MRNWVIQIYEYDKATKTGRWVTFRHRDSQKNVARFEVFGTLHKFVKHHALALGQRCRAHNELTHEYREIQA
jgi:hypothetical protein